MQVAIGWVAILLTFGFASVCGDYFLDHQANANVGMNDASLNYYCCNDFTSLPLLVRREKELLE